jgi:hypothetical protein
MNLRMLKKAVQQGRSELRGENAAGGLFQHPVRGKAVHDNA